MLRWQVSVKEFCVLSHRLLPDVVCRYRFPHRRLGAWCPRSWSRRTTSGRRVGEHSSGSAERSASRLSPRVWEAPGAPQMPLRGSDSSGFQTPFRGLKHGSLTAMCCSDFLPLPFSALDGEACGGRMAESGPARPPSHRVVPRGPSHAAIIVAQPLVIDAFPVVCLRLTSR